MGLLIKFCTEKKSAELKKYFLIHAAIMVYQANIC